MPVTQKPAAFRVHFIVPDDAGDIITEPLTTEPGAEAARITFARGFRGRAACGLPREKLDGVKERGSGVVKCCWCNACKETDIYKAMKAQWDEQQKAEADGLAEGAKKPCKGCK